MQSLSDEGNAKMRKLYLCALLLAAVVGCQAQVTITEYPVSTTEARLSSGIAAGPDGNMWFIDGLNGTKIAKMTPAGVLLTEFTIPNLGQYGVGSAAFSITAGPDGNLWFAEYFANSIGRITPSGVITEFAIPTPGNGPSVITVGPDGNLWFTEYWTNKIGRITTAGAITEFQILSGGYAGAWGITAGPDGNLWFTECACSNGSSAPRKVGKITPAGVITEYAGPASGAYPYFITAGADGNLWFLDGPDHIARMTTAGVITELPIPTSASSPSGITAGPDGNVWFTEGAANNIARITPGGVVTEFPIPTSASSPAGIATLSGNLWFTENTAKKIGKVGISVAFASFQPRAVINIPNHEFWTAVDVTLGATSNGISPLTETVQLQVGTFSTILPPGSFKPNPFGGFQYLNGLNMIMVISPVGGNKYVVAAAGWNTNLTGTTNPVTVRLTIGDDVGSGTFTAFIRQ